MKKRLLFFACFGMLFSLGAKAQTLNYDVSANNVGAVGAPAIAGYVEGGITLSTDAAIVVDGIYRMISVNGSALRIKLTSATDIRKVSLLFRGAGNTSTGIITVSYAVDNTSALTALPDVSVTSTIPGTMNHFLIPAGNKYVEIKRNTNTARVYQILAGPTEYTLPLDLLSFSAKPDAFGKSVNLNWKTTNEINTQDFVIERRTDDTEFAAVGMVLSKNVAGTHNYAFSDQKPVAGNSYYRLKQRDKDGKFTYSDIANVKIEGVSLSLHPNPVVSELVVNHEYAKKSSVLKVLSLDGKNVIKTNTAIGSSSTKINVAALSSGTYLLVQDIDGKTQSQKFIKK